MSLLCMRCGGPPAALVQTATGDNGLPIMTPLCVLCMAAVALPAQFTGVVTTPANPLPPNGPMFGLLEIATTRENILDLRDRATRQGYSAGGQLMTAIADKLAALDRRAPTKKAKKTTRRK